MKGERISVKRLIAFISAISILLLSFGFATYANSSATITVYSVTASRGTQIDIPIRLTNNPGIEAMQLFVEYDEGLSLVGAEKGMALNSLNYTPSGRNDVYPFILLWDGMSQDTTNGILATLKFDVKEDAVGEPKIKIYTKDGMIYNHDMVDVPVSFVSGKVKLVNQVESSPTPTVLPTSAPTPTVMPIGSTKIRIESAEVMQGETVTVPVVLEGNSGITGMQLYLEYSDELVLTKVEQGEALSTLTYTPSGSYDVYPFMLLWDGIENDISNGVLAYLTFQVSESAPIGNYEVKLYSNVGMIYDSNLNDVDVTFEASGINVKEHIIATPTAKPTATPTAKPTATPTAKPTATPTAKPTAPPTAKPTVTPLPTEVPDNKPSTNTVINVEENQYVLLSTLNNIQDGNTVVIASYDLNGRLVSVQLYKKNENVINAAFDASKEIFFFKIMVWDSMEKMNPITESEICYVE